MKQKQPPPIVRRPERDLPCGYCLFEGRNVWAFSYSDGANWCSWHRCDVPVGEAVVPRSAQPFPEVWR